MKQSCNTSSQKSSNNVTPAHENVRKSGTKKVEKVCSNYLTPEGIVEGNDPYMYGEKVKAYLINGARQLRIESIYPNRTLGYGALCLRDSLPG